MAIDILIGSGQSGVDRAALEWGLANGYQVGGYCTRGHQAEDGEIPIGLWAHLQAVCSDYSERTRRNVAESDATLILWAGEAMSPSSRLALETAERLEKPHVSEILPPADPAACDEVARRVAETLREWAAGGVRVVNVAGTRESKAPGIYRAAWEVLTRALPSRADPQA